MIDKNLAKLSAYIEKQGLRHSLAREIVAKEFFKTNTHVTVESLLQKSRKLNPKVGIATVYRTLHLLQECGLAIRRDFDNGVVAFEPLTEHHHDHLICTSCGKIVEFFFPEIEEAQIKVAQSNQFLLQHHKMELYGLCEKCQMLKRKKGKNA